MVAYNSWLNPGMIQYLHLTADSGSHDITFSEPSLLLRVYQLSQTLF